MAAAKDGAPSQELKTRGRQIVDGRRRSEEGAALPKQDTFTSPPDTADSPQARVALGRLAEEVVEKVSGVEVAQHDCRMRTWSSWPANP